jgi:hypothetical protein
MLWMPRKPRKPPADVREQQDPEHIERDFLKDLERASTNDARKRLDLPSAPDRGSSKTSE